MPCVDFSVRAARRGDSVAAGLLYESAAPYYDAYFGTEHRARRVLGAIWRHPGHTASYETCRVAALADDDPGGVLGVVSGFPLADGDRLANAFVSRSTRAVAPWRWPRIFRHLRAAARLTPRPPADAYYVDALAVAGDTRRRGVARALLDDAARRATAVGASGVALDTGLGNAAARALYEASGFERVEVRTAPDPETARAIGGRGFVSYFRPV
jgi:ribosomal protein S18 acetylase RimI-like enzyme